MKYEWLFREEIDHGLALILQINTYRHGHNHTRPRDAISLNRPADIRTGHADRRPPPTSRSKKPGQLLDARQIRI